MIPKEQLAAWRAVTAAATGGPWSNRIGIGPCDYIVKAERSDDAAFIAASRTAVPALLDEVERLRNLVGEACDLADIADDLIDPAALPCGEDRDAASDRLAAIRKEAGCE